MYKIAVIQILVTRDKAENLKHAKELIIEASKKADIIVLPEMFNCPYNAKTFHKYAEAYLGPTTQMLSELALLLKKVIVAGSIPEEDQGKLYNTAYTFGPEGQLLGKYRKIHLFDVAIKDGISFKESDVISPGEKALVIDLGDLKIGICICYDMRFPELFRTMVDLGAQMVIVPAAFNLITGPAHWHLTSRARAVDNQIYFVVASPSRSDYLSYKAYGHSMIVDPWGKIIEEANTGEMILYSDIDLAYVKKVRSELPLLTHRKPSVYS